MSLTVGEALKLNVFQKCRLLTGEAGLGNVILWVNILEILDDLSHIEHGELLITTAHGFKKSDQDYQKTMIELFAKKKLAAVAIQTGHYVQKLPESFIELARAHSIPVIEIPPEVSFKRITRALIGRLVEKNQTRLKESADKNHKSELEHRLRKMNNLWRELLSSSNPEDYHH